MNPKRKKKKERKNYIHFFRTFGMETISVSSERSSSSQPHASFTDIQLRYDRTTVLLYPPPGVLPHPEYYSCGLERALGEQSAF